MFYSGIADEAGTPISEQIRAHKQLGWNWIEVRNIEGGNLAEVDDATFEKTLDALNRAGIRISCFASGIANWARNIDQNFQRDVDDLKRAIPRMTKSGTKFIRVMSWPNAAAKPLTDSEWKKEALKRMKVLVKMAEDGGVVIAHENCSGWGGHSPQTMKELLSEIKSRAFGIVYDTGNPVAEGQKAWEMYQACKPRIVYVHIKDVKSGGAPGKYTPCWVGEGEGQVREVLVDLLKNKYDGGISIEPHLASQVHLGTKAEGNSEAYNIYIEYGRRLMKLVDSLKK